MATTRQRPTRIIHSDSTAKLLMAATVTNDELSAQARLISWRPSFLSAASPRQPSSRSLVDHLISFYPLAPPLPTLSLFYTFRWRGLSIFLPQFSRASGLSKEKQRSRLREKRGIDRDFLRGWRKKFIGNVASVEGVDEVRGWTMSVFRAILQFLEFLF